MTKELKTKYAASASGTKKPSPKIAIQTHSPHPINPIASIIETLRSSWFIIMFIGTVVYWVARMDSSINDIKKHDAQISTMEVRIYGLESGIAQLQLKLDGIKEDVTLIKSAVIK